MIMGCTPLNGLPFATSSDREHSDTTHQNLSTLAAINNEERQLEMLTTLWLNAKPSRPISLATNPRTTTRSGFFLRRIRHAGLILPDARHDRWDSAERE
jgi:hypothetical protein